MSWARLRAQWRACHVTVVPRSSRRTSQCWDAAASSASPPPLWSADARFSATSGPTTKPDHTPLSLHPTNYEYVWICLLANTYSFSLWAMTLLLVAWLKSLFPSTVILQHWNYLWRHGYSLSRENKRVQTPAKVNPVGVGWPAEFNGDLLVQGTYVITFT